MRKPITFTCAVIALGAALAGCGSSSSAAAGVQLAPSAGATAATVTPTTASSTSTTTTSSTSQFPLPAALKTKPAVVPPSGPPPKKLVIKDLIKGTGPAAKATSTVTVNYVGIFYKGGKEFDSSWKRGQVATFPLSGVIRGWTVGIPGMKVGGRRQLIIPPSLAYKAAGRPPTIPPNATLEFVIDLHGVSG